jgi:hypothetical protein
MKWCAREQGRLDRMSLLELLAEEERLEDLFGKANSAWHTSKKVKVDEREKTWTRNGKTESVLTITKTPQTGNVRYLEIAQRLAGRLRIVGSQIEERVREMAAPLPRREHTVPKRTRKRKRMGGRGLQLPHRVGTAPRALPAMIVWKRLCVAQLLKGGLRHAGIPPPVPSVEASRGGDAASTT